MKETISRNLALSQLKLKDLLLFDTLFRTKSLTESAAHLDLTVPSAGRMLNKIREAFDDPLFTRGGSGLVPTPKAVLIYKKVKHILTVFDDFQDGDVFEPSEISRNFTIGIADNAMADLMPYVIEDTLQTAPNASFSIQVIDNTLYDRLKNGQLDCAILADLALPDTTFHKIRIGTGSCHLYVRSDHPLARIHSLKRPVFIHDVDRWPQIRIRIRSLKGRTVGSIDNGLFRNLGNRKTVIELPYFFSSILMLLRTSYTLVLPKNVGDFAVKFFPIVEIPVADAPDSSYDLSLIWHDRVHDDASNQFLRASIVHAAHTHYSPENFSDYL